MIHAYVVSGSRRSASSWTSSLYPNNVKEHQCSRKKYVEPGITSRSSPSSEVILVLGDSDYDSHFVFFYFMAAVPHYHQITKSFLVQSGLFFFA
jgi:hypothetical protein